MVTVFAVNVTNAKEYNVSTTVNEDFWRYYDFDSLHLSDKSLRIMELCSVSALSKKDMMLALGVTDQTNNVRAIVDPLLTEELIWPCAEDSKKVRGVRYELTTKGKAYMKYIKSLV